MQGHEYPRDLLPKSVAVFSLDHTAQDSNPIAHDAKVHISLCNKLFLQPHTDLLYGFSSGYIGTCAMLCLNVDICMCLGFILACKDFGRMFNYSFPACASLIFLKVELSSCSLIPFFMPDQSVEAQLAEMTVAKSSLTNCL